MSRSNVVLIWMEGATAPVAGSTSRPAWMDKVSNFIGGSYCNAATLLQSGWADMPVPAIGYGPKKRLSALRRRASGGSRKAQVVAGEAWGGEEGRAAGSPFVALTAIVGGISLY